MSAELRTVAKETALLLAITSAVSLVLGFARGLPTPPQSNEEQASCEAPGGTAAAGPQWVSLDVAKSLFGGATIVFVDARSLDEYARGHVAGALPIPPSSASPLAEDLISVLQSATTVIAYCDTSESCGRSTRLATQILSASQVQDVRVLEGGMPGWIRRGFPAESGPCTTGCTWLAQNQ